MSSMSRKVLAISTQNVLQVCQRRCLHLSAVNCVYKKKHHGFKWRNSQGMSRSGNEYGVLTDKPDYSFLDGRPTPITFSQQRRREKQIATARDIMTKLGQMNFAQERFQMNEQAKKEQRQSILEQKLKPKS